LIINKKEEKNYTHFKKKRNTGLYFEILKELFFF